MNNELPLVSICVPTYNSEVTIRETLETILSQSYTKLVVHISDNASTDGTLQVIRSISDSRVTIHPNINNIGGEANFTRCIELSEGKYSAIFHADDLYESDMLIKQVKYLEENPNICAVFTAATAIDERGEPLFRIGLQPFCFNKKAVVYDFKKLLKTVLRRHNFLICPSVMVRTEVYKNVIKHWGNEKFNTASDVDTWLRLSEFSPIAVLNEPLMRYRISRAQYSEKNRNRVTRSDFFLVMDDYLSRKNIRGMLSKKDFMHYRWLLRHERLACSINLMSRGEVEKAKEGLRNIFCWDSLRAAFSSKHGLLTLAGCSLAWILIFFNKSDQTAKIIKKVNKIIGR